MVYLLEIKFSIGYDEAVDFHPGAGHIFSVYTIVQAMVYLLEIKFSIEYNEAIDFHQRKLYPH